MLGETSTCTIWKQDAVAAHHTNMVAAHASVVDNCECFLASDECCLTIRYLTTEFILIQSKLYVSWPKQQQTPRVT